MFRFIAIIAATDNNLDADLVMPFHTVATRRAWVERYRDSGMQVFTASCDGDNRDTIVLPNASGLVIGTIFSQDDSSSGSQALRSISDTQTDLAIQSFGRSLVTRYWGRFIAILSDHNSHTRFVVRDPLGDIPCYRARYRDSWVVFSHLQDLDDLLGLPTSIDWRYIALRISLGQGERDRTALREVSELHGGQSWEFRAGRAPVVKTLWDPATISKTARYEDLARARLQFADRIQSSTAAWAGVHNRALLELSGGLDSSIVLSCLAEATSRPNVLAVTSYWPGGVSNELRYASASAEAAGVAMRTFERSPRSIDLSRLLEVFASPFPSSADYAYLELSDWESSLAESFGASAIFDGAGGDGLFGHHGNEYAALDFVVNHGLSLGLAKVCAHVARLTNKSFYQVLRAALAQRLFRHEAEDFAIQQMQHRRLLSATALAAARGPRDVAHPWHENAASTAPGTAMLIFSLAVPRTYYDPLRSPTSRTPEHVHPLLAQPVVELALQVPSYLHNLDGRDRGLIRQAFAEKVPSLIIARQWKDRPRGLIEQIMVQNLPFVRELLLNGQLVKERLLEREQLDAALSLGPNDTSRRVFVGELMDYVLVESWLQVRQRSQSRTCEVAA